MRLGVGTCLAVMPLLAASVGYAAPVVVQVQAVRISDDDGARAARVTPEQVATWVAFADRVFAPAGIALAFDPANFVDVRSTLLNGMMGTDDREWKREELLGNETAARFPGKLVILFRHGPGEDETGGGFSWSDYDFVVMPGFEADSHCGHPHVDALAHEVGHFFGLAHTFVGQPVETTQEAEAALSARGGSARAFDGDRLSDTPPDPSIRGLECQRTSSVTLGGQAFELPRSNIMSYYDERSSLSPLQVARVQEVLALRVAGGMAAP